MKNYLGSTGILNSVYPCTEYLTFAPWIYMVPQFHPKSVLMLGYAGGTAAGLIRKLYGDVPITAVDIEYIDDHYGVDFLLCDAAEYVKYGDWHEATIVDVYDDGSPEPCQFVLEPEFVSDISKITDYLIVHTSPNTDMSAYSDLYQVQTITYRNSTFYYYMINDIPRLPIR